MEPFAHGESMDVSETGLSFVATEPLLPGERVSVEAPALFQALDLRTQKLDAVVRELDDTDDGRFRIGVAWVAPAERVVVALRRAVLKLQRRGDELDSQVVDWISLPER